MLSPQKGIVARLTLGIGTALLALTLAIYSQTSWKTLGPLIDVSTTLSSYNHSSTPNGSARHLHKRTFDYDLVKMRGEALMCLMATSDEDLTTSVRSWNIILAGDVAQRTFQYADLTNDKNGWEQTNSLPFQWEGTMIFNEALKDLNLPTALSDSCKEVTWKQEDGYIDGQGVEQDPTEAEFSIIYDATKGMVINYYVYSPAYKVAEHGDPNRPLPQIRQLADVAALEYIHQAQVQKTDAKNLKYLFHSASQTDVSTDACQAIFRKAGRSDTILGPDDLQVVPALRWPDRSVYKMDTDDGMALLGTPSGVGIAMMLLRWRQKLGHKTISQVTVFRDDKDDSDDEYRGPNLLFEIEDV